MRSEAWHIVWTTRGGRLPGDPEGNWARLAEFYGPLMATGLVTSVSSGLQPQYRARAVGERSLLRDDAADLHRWLLELTKEEGDRIAGGNRVLAAAFLPDQAHVLMECDRDRVRQVVGRLKSRLATLLLFQPRWANAGRHIWGSRFWQAEIAQPELRAQVARFISRLGAA